MSTETSVRGFKLTIDENGELEAAREFLRTVGKEMKAESLLQNALNAAATKGKKALLEGVKSKYDLSDKRSLKDKKEGAPYVVRAKPGTLSATIHSHGHKLALTRFRTMANSRQNAAKARVLKASSVKSLVSEVSGAKAFVTTFSTGHVAVVQRNPPEKYESANQSKRTEKYGIHADMTQIKQLLGPSMPQMLESDDVRLPVDEQMQEILHKEVEKRLLKLIEGA